ncbi:hypothetical protein [Pseudomonas sp.]|uniref:hypothetical protein n=1 Tax=Pseudomonas sp. TaxID=306 RepID=UPI003FD77364
MAVPAGPTEKRYTGNGVTKIFTIPFLLIAATDLDVFIDGIEVVSGYTITGAGNPTSTITFTSAPGSLSDILLRLNVPFERLNDYQENGDFLAGTVNRDFDRIWQALKQLNLQSSRSPVLGASDVDGTGFYRAKGNGLTGLASAAFKPDAATNWKDVSDYVASILATGQGPINNAANIVYIGADGASHSVQDLSGIHGAEYLGHNGGQVSEFLDAGWFQPNDIDLTGVTEQGTKILAYLNKYKKVKLPAGVIKASLVVPSGCSLTGAGRTDLNRVTKVWASGGTTIIGEIGFTGSVGCTLTRCNVDAYAGGGNAVAGVNENTRDHMIIEVNTRANNHNQLWEQNGSDPGGSKGGNILIQDCKAFDGPNGFVTKMKDVTMIRALAYDITVQGHVVVSDNINGPAIYSRAQRTRMIDCGGDGCNIGVSVYSRDAWSSTNANSVAGTIDTYWSGTHTNVTAGQFHSGFFRPIDAGTTALFNDQITIGGGSYTGSPLFGIRFDDAARPRILGGHFQNCPNHIVFGARCVDPYVSPGITRYGAVNGILLPYTVESSNASAINVDIVRDLLVVRNTALTTLNSLVTSNVTKRLSIIIDDNFTTLIIGGRAMTGKGSSIDLFWDETAWTVVSASTQLSDSEVAFPYAFNLSLFWRSKAAFIEMAGNINVLDVAGAGTPPGLRTTLRLHAPSAFSVFNWSGVNWGATTPVGAITAGQTVLIQFYWTGATHLVESVMKF